MESGGTDVNNLESDLTHCVQHLAKGNIILYPTDTIWGLGCDATNEAAIERIFRMKHRNPNKSMIILCSDEDMIRSYVEDPAKILLNEMKTSQTPLTAVFKNAKNLPAQLLNSDNSIAIRIPDDAFCQRLLHQFKKPIVSTSANISHHASPQNFTEIDRSLVGLVDYVVQHRRDDTEKRKPSHIIRLNEQGKVEKVR